MFRSTAWPSRGKMYPTISLRIPASTLAMVCRNLPDLTSRWQNQQSEFRKAGQAGRIVLITLRVMSGTPIFDSDAPLARIIHNPTR